LLLLSIVQSGYWYVMMMFLQITWRLVFPDMSYLMIAVKPLCEIVVNLRDLPAEAFEKNHGPDGVFYSISYDLAIIFAPVIEFKMLYKGREFGKASAKYV
jgi:hypothetical protein